MPNNVGQMVSMMGYLVTAKPTSTHDRKRMYFGTFLDEDGLWIDTVHFPPVAALYPFRGKGVYMLMGKVVDDFGFLSLEIVAMQKLAYWPDPRYATENAVLLD